MHTIGTTTHPNHQTRPHRNPPRQRPGPPHPIGRGLGGAPQPH